MDFPVLFRLCVISLNELSTVTCFPVKLMTTPNILQNKKCFLTVL